MATARNTPEGVVREIKRKTRRVFNSEEKIRIILERLRGEDSTAEISRREGSTPVNTTSGARSFSKPARNGSMVIR